MADLSEIVAESTSRRGFLARIGGLLLAAASGGGVLGAGAERADAFHICGHTWSTGACPHPTGMPRIDARGYPLRASDGKPVDDLGRVINAQGRAVNGRGQPLRDPAGRLLPRATRSRICVDAIPARYGISAHQDGAWYRCCRGRVRKLMDCCSTSRRRINGDRAVTGYCSAGRRVFCIQYFDTNVPC